jgi:hypothetical protein
MNFMKIMLFMAALLSLSSCTPDSKADSVHREKTVSYIQDDRTNLCFAVYKEVVECIPCTYEVTYEAYFNYKGVYIPKH